VPSDAHDVERRTRELATSGAYRITGHVHQEMVAEDVSLDEVLEAIAGGVLLESVEGRDEMLDS